MHTDIIICHKPNMGWVAYVHRNDRPGDPDFLPKDGFYETQEMAQRDATRIVKGWFPQSTICVTRGNRIPQW